MLMVSKFLFKAILFRSSPCSWSCCRRCETHKDGRQLPHHHGHHHHDLIFSDSRWPSLYSGWPPSTSEVPPWVRPLVREGEPVLSNLWARLPASKPRPARPPGGRHNFISKSELDKTKNLYLTSPGIGGQLCAIVRYVYMPKQYFVFQKDHFFPVSITQPSHESKLQQFHTIFTCKQGLTCSVDITLGKYVNTNPFSFVVGRGNNEFKMYWILISQYILFLQTSRQSYDFYDL